ncbi:hypothetical protein BN874_80054 [Candidatus Contendobacter odensis Run_B_J11]|uniref:Uncharacterized protein n=1 Tax=Candidatus Contendobacter odensis Run_B_J11 TaxID=1400861 RepID=A0A7U7GFM2_9GAMM|nr:hypothetical protein BN874_80054 [Candidatus Contendobacter odensis Run_B_J11]
MQTGKRGRPRKTLPKGGRVRLKNLGRPRHRRGRKRPKDPARQPEPHLASPDFPETALHAPPLEGHHGVPAAP